MSTSLSNLVDNLSSGTNNQKCANCGSNLEHISIKKSGRLLFK